MTGKHEPLQRNIKPLRRNIEPLRRNIEPLRRNIEPVCGIYVQHLRGIDKARARAEQRVPFVDRAFVKALVSHEQSYARNTLVHRNVVKQS